MSICDFHNKNKCHLRQLQERKRRQKKKKNGNLCIPLHFKKYDGYKMQEYLGKGSKRNCSSLAALYDTAKGEALTEGSKDLCQVIKAPIGGCRSLFYPGKTGKQY